MQRDEQTSLFDEDASGASPAQKEGFEAGVKRLEKLVEALEGGKMPLEESFHAYEEGARLLKQLKRQLTSYESRVRVLTPSGETEDFEPEEDE